MFCTRLAIKLHPLRVRATDSIRISILSYTNASVSFLPTFGDRFSAHQNKGEGYPVLLFLPLLLLPLSPPSLRFSLPWPITMNSNVRQTAHLSGNNQWHSCIQDSARRPSVAAELAGVPAASQSESDPDAPLFAQSEEMNEDAQCSRWRPTSTNVGSMTFFLSPNKDKK